MFRSLFLLACLSFSVFGKGNAFSADEHHISFGGVLAYHQGYTIDDPQKVGGGFTLTWDHAMKKHAFFSMGADIQTTWYGKSSADNALYRLSTTYRFGFHPFNLPALDGEVAIANQFDPYVVMRGGLHIDSRRESAVMVAFSPIVLGARWYFNENFAVWGEFDSWYGLAVGIGFWL